MPDTFFGALKSWLKAPLTSFKQLQKLTKFDDCKARRKEQGAKSKEQRARSKEQQN